MAPEAEQIQGSSYASRTYAVAMTNSEHIKSLPRTVAYVGAGDDPNALPSLLLEDFDDALHAYARLGGVDAPQRVEDAIDADAVVIAMSARRPSLVDPPALSHSALVYVLIACDGAETDEARLAMERTCGLLGQSGAMLAGCVLIPLAGQLERHMKGPRMGHARRNVSEATDELVLALRCAATPGVIEVRPPWPRVLHRLGSALRGLGLFS